MNTSKKSKIKKTLFEKPAAQFSPGDFYRRNARCKYKRIEHMAVVKGVARQMHGLKGEKVAYVIFNREDVFAKFDKLQGKRTLVTS